VLASGSPAAPYRRPVKRIHAGRRSSGGGTRTHNLRINSPNPGAANVSRRCATPTLTSSFSSHRFVVLRGILESLADQARPQYGRLRYETGTCDCHGCAFAGPSLARLRAAGPTDSAALFAWKPATHRVPRPVKTEAPKVAPNTNPDLGARVGHVSRLRTRLAECFSDESEVGNRGFQFLDDFSSHNGRRRRFSTSSSDSSRSQKMSRLALSRSSTRRAARAVHTPPR
jgi:hypothetical protein